ncbi:MAG: TA system VapC family ribonuclease toxin [Gammaproteobacteria bacterium]
MRALFDVNVLIAIFDPAHVHHERAHAWLAAEQHHGWATCPLTQNGFVRIISQPRYPNAISTADAIGRLRRATGSGTHAFWTDHISIADESRFVEQQFLGPRQVTDLYLLGLAVHNEGRLVTFDQALSTSAVAGASGMHLVTLT